MEQLNMNFLLEDRIGETTLYEGKKVLQSFQVEMITNKDINFFYHLKDSAISIEEKLFPKIATNSGEDIGQLTFKLLFEDNVYFSFEIEQKGLSKEDFKKSEVEVFYFMENIISKFDKEVTNEHKNFILNVKK